MSEAAAQSSYAPASPSAEKPTVDPADRCGKGDLPASVTFAQGLLKGTDLSAKRGCEDPLRKACDGSIGRACSDLGRLCLPTVILAARRNTFISDKKEQAAHNQKACDLGDGYGCYKPVP